MNNATPIRETLEWEGITWTLMGGYFTLRPVKCDGCENETTAFNRYKATDPEGTELRADWCLDCLKFAAWINRND